MQAYPWRASVGHDQWMLPRVLSIRTPPSSGRDRHQSITNADLLTAATPTTVHEDTWLVRIDHKINEKTLLYGRAQRDISLVDAPNGSSLPADKLQTINHPANYLLALEHTFTPNSVQRSQVLHQSLALPQSAIERSSVRGEHRVISSGSTTTQPTSRSARPTAWSTT